jgi:TonB-dependent SusC/RagA subfamily outer membrane receptor
MSGDSTSLFKLEIVKTRIMKISIVFCIFLILIAFTGSYGQKSGKKITITGTVADETKATIANAIIMIDGEKTDNVTDSKGRYKVRVTGENKKIGIFTFTNGIVEEEIGGREKVNFTFKGSVPDQKTDKVDFGEEPVNMGYETVKRKAVTGSVGTIDGTQSKYASYNSIYDMLRGEIPGVQVTGTSIMIRSTTTANSGTEPMFVVDGVPVNTIGNIQPQMVKSIQVLKGSSAAIYGSRGSNGVIIINLLTGKDR